MIVVRMDLFSFKITLSQAEFDDIKDVDDYENIPIEDILSDVIQCGFDVLTDGKPEKE